jgi:hypothetical protein
MSHNHRITAYSAHPLPLPPLPLQGEGEPNMPFPPSVEEGLGMGDKGDFDTELIGKIPLGHPFMYLPWL